MSWFSSVADTLARSISETTNNVNLQHGRELLAALTLNTPEMTAEREQMLLEDTRRLALKDALASLLPWETSIEDKAILVEECQEAVLSLSGNDITFLGQEAPSNNNHETETAVHMVGESQSTYLALCRAIANSKVVTAKGSGIPPLLEHFDLDAHVGLIDRVLKVDPRLVEQHAKLSGTHVSEINFWKNYFYNCAMTRLEVGLSLEEIWGNQLPTSPEEMAAAAAKATQSKSKPPHNPFASLVASAQYAIPSSNTTNASSQTSAQEDPDSEHEEEISFEDDRENTSKTAMPVECTAADVAKNTLVTPRNVPASSFSLPPLLSATKADEEFTNKSSALSIATPTDFEMVSSHPELSPGRVDDDDLDAEIARELEGL